MTVTSLLLPAHGHAPYILGTKILRTVASEICIPDYYGDKQQNILLDVLKDFPEYHDKVFLSKALGESLLPLLRDSKITPKFSDYAASVRGHFETKSNAIKKLILDGVEAISLNGEKKYFPRFDLALNTGLPVLSPVDPVFYVFVGEMSAIYRLSPFRNEDTEFLEQVWKIVEPTFKRMFIPVLHSLAYREDQDLHTDGSKRITFTPPLESPYSLDNSLVALDGKTPIDHGSTLVVFSGTGIDQRKLLSLAQSVPGTSFTLPDTDRNIKLPRVLPSAWNNPNITTVLARSGLGSVWNAVLNGKPIGVLKAPPENDPEIYHNARMVEWAGIGKILNRSIAPLVDDIQNSLVRIQEWQDTFERRFETVDGINYTADELKRSLSL